MARMLLRTRTPSGGLSWHQGFGGLILREPFSPEIRDSCCFLPLCAFASKAVAVPVLYLCPFLLSRSPVMLFALGCGIALFVVWCFTNN